MAGDALQVEPVEESVTTVTAGERSGAGGSATIYWWQIALLAARAGALERELECERRRHQRVIERYEKLLTQREEEIETLRTDRGEEPGRLRSLLP